MMLLPRIAFVILIVVGLRGGDFGTGRALLFVAVWILALVGFPLLGWSGYAGIPVEVVLDIILILTVFGGDIRIR